MDSDAKPFPFSGGPYLLVALPRFFDEFVPMNATSLIREWEMMLDPIRGLQWAAGTFLDRLTWTVGEKFVTPNFATMEWLRRASRDGRITSAFAKGTGDLARARHEYRPGLRGLLALDVHDEDDVGTEVLDDDAMPVLLGLAVVAAVLHELGTASMAIREKLPDDFRDRLEQHRLEDEERRQEHQRRLEEERDRLAKERALKAAEFAEERARRAEERARDAEYFKEHGVVRPAGLDAEQLGKDEQSDP